MFNMEAAWNRLRDMLPWATEKWESGDAFKEAMRGRSTSVDLAQWQHDQIMAQLREIIKNRPFGALAGNTPDADKFRPQDYLAGADHVIRKIEAILK